MNSLLIYFATSLWISHIVRDVTINSLPISRIPFPFIFDFMNSLSISRRYHEFTVCFRNPLWISYLSREFTMNFPSFSRIYYEFRIFIADSSRIHLMFQEFTLNSLFIWQNFFKITFYLRILLWVYLVLNLLWIHYRIANSL